MNEIIELVSCFGVGMIGAGASVLSFIRQKKAEKEATNINSETMVRLSGFIEMTSSDLINRISKKNSGPHGTILSVYLNASSIFQ